MQRVTDGCACSVLHRFEGTDKQAKKASWYSFVSTVNNRTSLKTAWDVVRKIEGKNAKQPLSHLVTATGNISSKTDIANTIAHTIHSNSLGKLKHRKSVVLSISVQAIQNRIMTPSLQKSSMMLSTNRAIPALVLMVYITMS